MVSAETHQGQPLILEMQPSLMSLQRTVEQCICREEGRFAELKMQMQMAVLQRDSQAMSRCEQTGVAMDEAVHLEIVKYLNRFWARFLRLGKPWMVQELGERVGSEPMFDTAGSLLSTR